MSDLVPDFVEDYPVSAGLLIVWFMHTAGAILAGDYADGMAMSFVVAVWLGWLGGSMTWTAEEARGEGS